MKKAKLIIGIQIAFLVGLLFFSGAIAYNNIPTETTGVTTTLGVHMEFLREAPDRTVVENQAALRTQIQEAINAINDGRAGEIPNLQPFTGRGIPSDAVAYGLAAQFQDGRTVDVAISTTHSLSEDFFQEGALLTDLEGGQAGLIIGEARASSAGEAVEAGSLKLELYDTRRLDETNQAIADMLLKIKNTIVYSDVALSINEIERQLKDTGKGYVILNVPNSDAYILILGLLSPEENAVLAVLINKNDEKQGVNIDVVTLGPSQVDGFIESLAPANNITPEFEALTGYHEALLSPASRTSSPNNSPEVFLKAIGHMRELSQAQKIVSQAMANVGPLDIYAITTDTGDSYLYEIRSDGTLKELTISEKQALSVAALDRLNNNFQASMRAFITIYPTLTEDNKRKTVDNIKERAANGDLRYAVLALTTLPFSELGEDLAGSILRNVSQAVTGDYSLLCDILTAFEVITPYFSGRVSSIGEAVTVAGITFTKLPADAPGNILTHNRTAVESFIAEHMLTTGEQDATPKMDGIQHSFLPVVATWKSGPALILTFNTQAGSFAAKQQFPVMIVVKSDVTIPNKADDFEIYAIRVEDFPVEDIRPHIKAQEAALIEKAERITDPEKRVTAQASAEVWAANWNAFLAQATEAQGETPVRQSSAGLKGSYAEGYLPESELASTSDLPGALNVYKSAMEIFSTTTDMEASTRVIEQLETQVVPRLSAIAALGETSTALSPEQMAARINLEISLDAIAAHQIAASYATRKDRACRFIHDTTGFPKSVFNQGANEISTISEKMGTSHVYGMPTDALDPLKDIIVACEGNRKAFAEFENRGGIVIERSALEKGQRFPFTRFTLLGRVLLDGKLGIIAGDQLKSAIGRAFRLINGTELQTDVLNAYVQEPGKFVTTVVLDGVVYEPRDMGIIVHSAEESWIAA